MPEKLCWKFTVFPSFVSKIFIHTSYFYDFRCVSVSARYEVDPGGKTQRVNPRRHVDDIVVAGQAEITAAPVQIASD